MPPIIDGIVVARLLVMVKDHHARHADAREMAVLDLVLGESVPRVGVQYTEGRIERTPAFHDVRRCPSRSSMGEAVGQLALRIVRGGDEGVELVSRGSSPEKKVGYLATKLKRVVELSLTEQVGDLVAAQAQ